MFNIAGCSTLSTMIYVPPTSLFFFLKEKFTYVIEAKVECITAWASLLDKHKIVTRIANRQTKKWGSHTMMVIHRSLEGLCLSLYADGSL